ncbi:hypothetical protein [Microbacterium dauci]|uniref:Uncharacterized protein n=1 Tax=Microbacterium dauci TaxID=3048008 RepID=A0ABT6ZI88_9MICO|nr:hypothetical protein [Microbacterium sp. LX3-4]MDJ1115352.1 hypothetical protein [Microbacterium sp. LX3-4]
MIDIPAGVALVIAAAIAGVFALIGGFIAARRGRVARLERENRQLWFALRGVVDVLYRNNIPIPESLDKIINPPIEGDTG